MPNISLTNYTPQMRDVERARQYAQMLQEQAITPIEQQTVNGNPVPISWASVLAKGLQGYLGGRAARKVDEREAATKAAMMKEAMGYIAPENLNVEQAGSGLKQIGDVQFGNQGIVDRLKSMMPQGAPQPQASPVVGPAPQAMAAPGPEQAAPMPQMQPGVMPMQAPQGRMNTTTVAPKVSPAMPTQAINPDLIVSNKQNFAIPQELQDRTRSSEEKQRMLLAAALSDNPYLQKIAPSMYTEERAAGKAEKTFKDIGDATKLGLDPNIVKLFKATNDPTGLVKYASESGLDAQKQSAALNLAGFTAQARHLEEEANRNVRINIAAGQQALGNANLKLRMAEFNKDTLAPPTTVQTIVNGEPVQTVAMFNKRTGQYIDMTGKPVNSQGLTLVPNGGNRAVMGLLRQTTSAADAATDIENLSKLPKNSRLGWFSQAGNTPLSALNRIITPQEAQDMSVTMAGLSRAMGGLATGGLAVDKATQESYEALAPKAGQTRLTALRQMGSMRQQAVNGIEAALANPYITPQQKTNLQNAKTKIENAVPWTPNDVSNFEMSKNKNGTMKDMGIGQFGKTSAAGWGQAREIP